MKYFFTLQLFDSIASKNFNEPLQIIEKSKYALYVGAKSGNIYKLKLDVSIYLFLFSFLCQNHVNKFKQNVSKKFTVK